MKPTKPDQTGQTTVFDDAPDVFGQRASIKPVDIAEPLPADAPTTKLELFPPEHEHPSQEEEEVDPHATHHHGAVDAVKELAAQLLSP